MIVSRVVATCAVGAASAFGGAAALAQQPGDSTIRLGEIVVTATRLPVPRASVASPVTVVTGDALRAQGITSLLEALRGIPGTTLVQGGSFGMPASLFVRGGESDYVKVLVDGVPVNEPGGAFDFAHLATDNVERIEVVRGPASVLYGSDAVAGVVQIFTRPGLGGPRWRVAGAAGTFGSSQVLAELSAGSERAGASASVSRFASDGTAAFNSGYRRTDASGLLRARLGVRSDARLTVRVDDRETHFPTDGAGRAVDRNQYTTGRQTTVGLDARHVLSSRLELRTQLASNSGAAGYDDRADGPADTLGFFGFVSGGRTVRRSADVRAVAYLAPGTTFIVGGAIERQSSRSRDSAASQWGPSLDSLAAARRSGALYAQLLADPGRRVALNLGVRVDRSRRFGAFGTTRAGLSWRVAPQLRLRAAVGSALKEPTFFENFASGWVVGNPGLRPERSRSREIGADARIGRNGPALGVTVFAQRFADLIQYTAAPAAAGGPNYVNVAAARASGLEADASWSPVPGLTLGGRYTYLSTAVTDAGVDTSPDGAFAEGRPLLRRPSDAAGLSLSYATGRGSFTLAADHVGRRDDLDYSRDDVVTRVALRAHVRVDASAAVPLVGRAADAGVLLTVRIENLFGARYQEVRGFPARGRAILLGLRAEGGLR